jgi:hypothetical protein
MKSHEFRRALKAGRSSIGGNYSYGVFLVMTDGACLCWDCANEEKVAISKAAYSQNAYRDGWAPYGWEINWENELTCDNCSKEIEMIYPPDATFNQLER